MKNIQLTCAHALVKFIIAQKTLIDGKKLPLFPGVFGIFGHGNVACLGQALQENQKDLPTWRGEPCFVHDDLSKRIFLLGEVIMNKTWL